MLSRVIRGLRGEVGAGFESWERRRSGGFQCGNLLLLFSLLREAQLLFHLEAELVGGAAELTHKLAELTREFGQLLRTKEEEGENKEKGAIAEARHN